jgi:hypothetical protein
MPRTARRPAQVPLTLGIDQLGQTRASSKPQVGSIPRPPPPSIFAEASWKSGNTVSRGRKWSYYKLNETGLTADGFRFFYALITLLNMIAFYGAVSKARREGESLRMTVVSLFKGVVLNFPMRLCWVVYSILWIIPECIFRCCLPAFFKSKVRLGRRYALKTGLALGQEAEFGVAELKDVYKRVQRKRAPRYQGSAGEPSPLSEFLGIYDMLFAVIEEMHYSDIMSLSRVSKSVREAVLPANDIDRRVAIFEQYTCQSGLLKQNCYTCDKQICSVSSVANCSRRRGCINAFV